MGVPSRTTSSPPFSVWSLSCQRHHHRNRFLHRQHHLSLIILVIGVIISRVSPIPDEPDEDFFINEDELDEDIHSVPEIEIESILGGRAELPCDVNPTRRDDSVHMVLWFRDDFGKPVYSLDVRGKPFGSARHWSSSMLFGTRAHFRTVTEPARLVIENVKLTDEGLYRCRTDFKNTPTRNFRFNLTVLVPPESVSIHDATGRLLTSVVGPLREGSDLSLSCKVRGGKPTPHIEWRIGEERLLSNEPIYRYENEDVFTKQLRDVHVRREHHGQNLTCLAYNSNLTDPLSETLRLTLYLRPLSARINRLERLVANQRHEIECVATGSRPAAMITWWSSGNRQLTDVTILPNDEHKLLSSSSSSSSLSASAIGTGQIALLETDELENVTRSSLTLIPSIENDKEEIRCRAENPWVPRSVVEDAWILHVVYPPIVELRLGSALLKDGIKEGDDVYFECHLKSNPPIHKLSWMLNNHPLSHNTSAGVIISNQSLVLQGINRTMAGAYNCLARNNVGTTVSNSFHLQVKYAPVCRGERESVVGVSKGERVTIKCELESDPQDVSFRWDLATSGQMIQVSPSRYQSAGSTSILHYAPVSNLDYGSLFCRGTNIIGVQMAPCIFQVVAAEKPSPVTNCTVFNETNESAELVCDEGHDGGMLQHFVLEVYENDSSEMRYNASSNVASFHLGNLSPTGTGFRVYVYAVNRKGRSEPYRLDELIVRQSEKYAAVSPSDYSWLSFAISVAIGGTAVFLCVGSVVIARVLHFRSRQMKRDSKKRHDEAAKNSTGSLQHHERQLESKDGISATTIDDKDPDIIPSNIEHSTSLSLSNNIGGDNNGGTGSSGTSRVVRFGSGIANACCLQQQQQSNFVAHPLPLDHHHHQHFGHQRQTPTSLQHQRNHYQNQDVFNRQQHHQLFGDEEFGTFRPYRAVNEFNASITGVPMCELQPQPSPGASSQILMNINSTSIHQPPHPATATLLRHNTTTTTTPNDPTYFDTKLMKQKLLSTNVPESCV